jgi:hypothetical protein
MLKQKPPERRVMFLSAGQHTEAPFLGEIEVKMLEGKPGTGRTTDARTKITDRAASEVCKNDRPRNTVLQ